MNPINMNSIKPNAYKYLVGYYEAGEFWCVQEFRDTEEDKARALFEDMCVKRPHRYIELIQQITMNKVVELYYPKLSHENI